MSLISTDGRQSSPYPCRPSSVPGSCSAGLFHVIAGGWRSPRLDAARYFRFVPSGFNPADSRASSSRASASRAFRPSLARALRMRSASTIWRARSMLIGVGRVWLVIGRFLLRLARVAPVAASPLSIASRVPRGTTPTGCGWVARTTTGCATHRVRPGKVPDLAGRGTRAARPQSRIASTSPRTASCAQALVYALYSDHNRLYR